MMTVSDVSQLYDGARLRIQRWDTWVEGTLHEIGDKVHWIFISDEPSKQLHMGIVGGKEIKFLDAFISRKEREDRCWWIKKDYVTENMRLVNKIIDLDEDDNDCI